MPRPVTTDLRLGSINGNWRGGKSSHELYEIYMDMIGRCCRPSHLSYANYGGRGIQVCQRWRDDFWNFVEDMGPRPEGKSPAGRAIWSLDRRDNDGNYEPSNCHWANSSWQAKNRRSLAWSGVLRGEDQKLHKLTADSVREIRSYVEAGGVQRRMAEKFEVSVSTISLVVKGKLWPHLN